MRKIKDLYVKGGAGQNVYRYTLTNTEGMAAVISNYGATLVSLKVPDRHGDAVDVVLGYDAHAAYIEDKAYMGATIGRYANRIADGEFRLHGKRYCLTRNEGANQLHGGTFGFNKAIWSENGFGDDANPELVMTYLSMHGEEGYPGNLSTSVSYRLTEKNELRIDYTARTDRATVLNLTHHSYFNLAGAGSGDILDHMLTIHADQFTPVNEHLIPTGELRSVEGTGLDFRQPRRVGERIDREEEQLILGGGYDHNFVLNKAKGALALAAVASSKTTGIAMKVYTTEPGLQFYTGNFLAEGMAGKDGRSYHRRGALCLETQHFPDSPNQPQFPSCILEPGRAYRQTTIYAFSA